MEAFQRRPLFYGIVLGVAGAAALVASAVVLPMPAVVAVAATIGWVAGRWS